MSSPRRPSRALSRALAAAAALLLLASPAAAEEPERGDFDARPTSGDAVPRRAEAAREALRERLGRFGLVAEDEHTGTARAVAKLDGFLTGPSARSGEAIALDYVRASPRVFGLDDGDVDALRLADRTFTGGVEYLRWEQRYRGIPSSDTQIEAAVTGAGRLITVTGPAAGDLTVASVDPSVAAEAAYAAVRRSARAARAAVAVRARSGTAERTTRFADGGTASLVLYQGAEGTRLAWRVLAPVSATGVYDATVDAGTGAIVRRANRVDFADALVYPSSPLDPVATVQLEAAWLEPTPTRLKGPRVHAVVDAGDVVGVDPSTHDDGEEVGPLPNDHWTFPLSGFASERCAPVECTWNPFVADSWEVNRKQSATQLFYLANTFLDHLAAAIGFDENDLGFGGDDPVIAQAMDGADGPAGGGLPDAFHVNNAGFLTLPEGMPAQLLSFLFSYDDPGPFGDLDAANDASVVYHELTHGLSNRLVTDAQGFGALNTAQAGAIGEGTSDFYAMDFLVGDADADADADAEHRVGRYLDGGDSAGLRYQAIDCDTDSVGELCAATPGGSGAGGFTYGDFGNVFPGPEVHADGEIWAQTLWDLRQSLGVQEARGVITAGMRLAPPEPSFLDMRNAILAASVDAVAEGKIWAVFAARGMGYFASSDGSTDVAPVPDASLPPTGTTSDLTGTVLDEEGDAVAGAAVGIAGHDTRGRAGLGPRHAAETDEQGDYEIADAPDGTYPLVTARHAGFREARVENVTLPADAVQDFTLVRDWSSAVNGATIERFSGPDNTQSGCGPGGLIDDQAASVWGSDRATEGQRIVVDLGAPIDVAGIAVDPGAGCGDDPSAGLGTYAISGSTAPDRGFVPLTPLPPSPMAFGLDDQGTLTDVDDVAGPRIRYVELHAKEPLSTSGSGSIFLDVAEIHVAKAPGAQPGPSTETLPAVAVSTRTARVQGTVIPHGAAPESMRFEYGPTSAYGSSVAVPGAPTGETLATFPRDLSGLQPDTSYHYRFVVTRGGIDYPGGDRTFRTVPAVAPPPTPTPTPTATPTPAPPDDGPVVSTSIRSERLTADRRGMFKVRWTFGDAAPSGKARVRVIGKRRKVIASAVVAVQPGRTITKTLRLNKAGRTMIRRGRSLKVSLELRLPGGGTLRERVRLSRKR